MGGKRKNGYETRGGGVGGRERTGMRLGVGGWGGGGKRKNGYETRGGGWGGGGEEKERV